MGSESRRVSPGVIVGGATALGIFSTFQAYNYVSTLHGRTGTD